MKLRKNNRKLNQTMKKRNNKKSKRFTLKYVMKGGARRIKTYYLIEDKNKRDAKWPINENIIIIKNSIIIC